MQSVSIGTSETYLDKVNWSSLKGTPSIQAFSRPTLRARIKTSNINQSPMVTAKGQEPTSS